MKRTSVKKEVTTCKRTYPRVDRAPSFAAGCRDYSVRIESLQNLTLISTHHPPFTHRHLPTPTAPPASPPSNPISLPSLPTSSRPHHVAPLTAPASADGVFLDLQPPEIPSIMLRFSHRESCPTSNYQSIEQMTPQGPTPIAFPRIPLPPESLKSTQ